MWVLIVIFHVNSGSSGFSQEFTSQATCERVKTMIYSERQRVGISGLDTAFCLPK